MLRRLLVPVRNELRQLKHFLNLYLMALGSG